MSQSHELDALREQNRRAADAATERKMVQLRTSLFARHERRVMGTGLGERKVQHAGYGLPVANRDELSVERLRNALSSYGALHVSGLLEPRRVEQMRAAIDAALEAQERVRSSQSATDSPWFDPTPSIAGGQLARDFVYGTGAALAVDSPRGLYQLLEMYYELGIDRLVTEYFGERPALSAEKTTLRRVQPGPEEIGWHQDGRFLGSTIRSFNVWIALTDCPDDAPGLEVLPTRLEHIVPTGTEGAKFDWCVSPLLVAQQFPGACIKPKFKAGDALMFDHFLLHRTFRNPAMTHPRYAIESWFFAPSAYPEAQTGLYV